MRTLKASPSRPQLAFQLAGKKKQKEKNLSPSK